MAYYLECRILLLIRGEMDTTNKLMVQHFLYGKRISSELLQAEAEAGELAPEEFTNRKFNAGYGKRSRNLFVNIMCLVWRISCRFLFLQHYYCRREFTRQDSPDDGLSSGQRQFRAANNIPAYGSCACKCWQATLQRCTRSIARPSFSRGSKERAERLPFFPSALTHRLA